MKHDKKIYFYFDFISPYAYFAWKALKQLCHVQKVELVAKPIVFGAVLSKWGQLGPAEIPPKRIHTFKDCFRFAKLNNIPFSLPKTHPFKSLIALRVSLPEVSGKKQHDVIDSLFNAIWGQGIDGAGIDSLTRALNQLGLDGENLIKKTQEKEIKEILKKETSLAIENGVFGVPAMIFENELYWGKDQLDYIERAFNGSNLLDGVDIDKALDIPSGADRKKSI